jgi:hypothetical protein
MSILDKIAEVDSFLENDENYQTEPDLYHLIVVLSRVLAYQLDKENNLDPIQPFGEEEQEQCLALVRRYLSQNNSGDEHSLMVRYMRNFFVRLSLPPLDDNHMPHSLMHPPPPLERSMNVTSAFSS